MAVASLGCSKNLVDTEVILGRLGAAGYPLAAEASEADVIIVNTCGFIQAAKEESIDAVLSLARWKGEGRCRALVLAGCLAQRYGAELLAELPEVDAVVGSGAYDHLPEIIERVLGGERVVEVEAPGYLPEEAPRLVTTGPGTAYLKVAEGCDHRCAFCAIPLMRGEYRSRALESIVAEAEQLVAQGRQELVLIAQDTTAYGRDRYGRGRLPELLRRLDQLEGLVWLRFLYGHPEHVTDELFEAMAGSRRVVPYLDLPLQHVNGSVLRRMHRAGDAAHYAELLTRARRMIPGLVIRSTFIVGFPGETEAQFEELVAFLQEQRLDHVGAFTYSPEEGTPAARLSGKVPAEVAAARLKRLISVQQEISRELNATRVGGRELVLVERGGRGRVFGRSAREAPEVDGQVVLAGTAAVGQFVWARIERAGAYDVSGKVEGVLP